jgi:hypothetical protein
MWSGDFAVFSAGLDHKKKSTDQSRPSWECTADLSLTEIARINSYGR